MRKKNVKQRLRLIALLLMGSIGTGAAGPAPPTDAILAEGLLLYASERSSWVATDLMMASIADRSELGGYLSYLRGDSVCTIFWPKQSAGTAGSPLLASYAFLAKDVRVETSSCRRMISFSSYEATLFAIRQKALAEIKSPNSDYIVPPKSALNLAFVNNAQNINLYVLTGPQEGGVIPIGNDRLLVFTPDGKLKSSERLHNSYLLMRATDSKEPVVSLLHTHLEAHPYITASDICAVLLYHEAIPAQQCLVMSKNYVSIFNIDKRQLIILTRKAFERIAGKSQTAKG